MKLSIVTPTHNPKNILYLIELFESIVAQTYENWEWVLFLNGDCLMEHIPDYIKNHPKVVTFRSFDTNTNVGAVKHQAFHIATGDVLVEVDHDDMITPDCLEKLAEAFEDESVGFAYSDNAVLHMNDEFYPFSEELGWSHRIFNWKGKDLYAMNSFEATSHSVGYIWFAPDHVRAWRASVYREIGGHNPELSICDDQELMIRTYLATKMKYIPEVLYIYRITGENTWLHRNEEIQETTVSLFNQYAQRLAEKDADERGLLKVDIGGGLNSYPGYKTVDIRDTADYVCDLNEGIPLPDDSVGVLNATHIIEHLHDKTKIMSEIHRVLAHGGWAFIEVPSTDGRGAFMDPTHVSYWNENSFLYYTHKQYGWFIDNDTIRFQPYRMETYFPSEDWQNLNICVTSAWLVAIKNDDVRYPGELNI